MEEKYFSLPMCLYLIGADGKIAYTGDKGLFRFNMDTWADAIEKKLKGLGLHSGKFIGGWIKAAPFVCAEEIGYH